jgi:hypothetical protein
MSSADDIDALARLRLRRRHAGQNRWSMTIQRMLANMTVTDLDSAVPWYTKLFGSAPDANPMEGLVEWHLDEKFGVQVWAEAERAGRSSMVLDETDLDERLVSVTEVGLANDGIQQASSSRILVVVDADGNRIVFTGP